MHSATSLFSALLQARKKVYFEGTITCRQRRQLTNSVAPEPAGSSQYSQQPVTGHYPEPTGSTPHPPPISQRSILIPFSNLRLVLSSGFFPTGFPTKTLYTSLSSPMMKLLTAQLLPFSCYFIPFGTNILLRTLFSNAFSLCSSLNAKDQVSNPYRTGRIMIYIF
jgi:hypothetical protein